MANPVAAQERLCANTMEEKQIPAQRESEKILLATNSSRTEAAQSKNL
jgi:hypothetical protein